MITSPRKRGVEAKKEANNKNTDGKLSKAPSSSRQSGGFHNPRIVRVSRSFGGKDRHSKVCTVRGLRDRRIRLSVPTAIQLYDLQDRLGLSQPSKVIDWLIEETKQDIDKLSPLQMPQVFQQFHQDPIFSHESNLSQSSHGEDHSMMEKSMYWDVNAASRGKSKVDIESMHQKTKWINTNEQDGIGGYNSYSSYYNWDPSNLSLSQFGGHGYLPHTENPNNNTAMPSSLAPPAGSQLFFCPSTSLFSPYPHTNSPGDNDTRHINNIQLLNSSSQHMLPSTHSISFLAKSSSLNVCPELHHSQSTKENQPDEVT